MANLTHRTLDSTGKRTDASLVGKIIQHTGNKKTYVITGFAWNGEDDRWVFLHHVLGDSNVTIARPLDHLTGLRSDGLPRYL